MTDNKTEHVDESELNQEFDIAEIEGRINYLHSTLDEIKDAGRNLGTQIGMKAGEADPDEVENYQRLIQRANLLTLRVEHGDRSIVRGE